MNETPEQKRTRRLAIWRAMTPEERDYDRYVGQIPDGASSSYETKAGQVAHEERQKQRDSGDCEAGCSCHISPPCSYCINDEAPDD